MSSNAFALRRSRPRVRHERVLKTQCYAHPRFLQLVKELARINDAKKKQEESEQLNTGSSSAKSRNSAVNTVGTCPTNDDCPNAPVTSAEQTAPGHRQHHSHHNHNQPQPSPLQPPQASTQHQQQSVADCWPINISLSGTSCCSNLNEAHSSHGCRSLECSQPSSALNDTYYRQNNNDNLPTSNHSMHQNYQRHYGYSLNHQNATMNNHLNNLGHLPPHDYRCPPSKCATASTPATNTNIGCSKASPIDQSASDFTNNESDARQDENRTKRKRSGNDTSNSNKKLSPTSPSSCNKRHKASPEPTRPLSPSFTKCPICLLDCMDRDPSFTNTCFHLFCYVCIENWSKSKATCPLCRTKFSKIIYNIRSASCFDEKVASPIRRDDDDDRVIYEQLHGLSASNLGSSRTHTNEEARMLFDNLSRSTQHGDVLMPHFALLNQSLNRAHVSALQSFNPVATNSNFNSGVPHAPFTAANYNPASSYIALIPNDRSQATASGPAIASAYAPNTSLSNSSTESSNRVIQRSRSGRFIYSRNYDITTIEGAARVSRSMNTELVQSGISLEPRHHHHQMSHGGPHQHHSQHGQPQQQHRATSTIELTPHRQVQRIDHHLPSHLQYFIPPRHYTNPHMYSRRPYTNPPAEQHILDNLYRHMPDM